MVRRGQVSSPQSVTAGARYELEEMLRSCPVAGVDGARPLAYEAGAFGVDSEEQVAGDVGDTVSTFLMPASTRTMSR